MTPALNALRAVVALAAAGVAAIGLAALEPPLVALAAAYRASDRLHHWAHRELDRVLPWARRTGGRRT